MEKNTTYNGLGRRKTSVARVILKKGNGNFKINKKIAEKYLISSLFLQDVYQPMKITKTENYFDINVNVKGGGISGQTGAIRLGIARALLKFSPDFLKELKSQKLLTRDARKKERKKPGLRKARKARQFSKR